MKKILALLLVVFALASCQVSEDEKAQPLMHRIDSLYQMKSYAETLNAITELRAKHPAAVESRKKALKIWQDVSLKMTQEDIRKTDSAYQSAFRQYESAHGIAKRNRLRARVDSLKIRYDALCGTVRVIHRRQQE